MSSLKLIVITGLLVAGCGGSHADGHDAGAPAADAGVPVDGTIDGMVDGTVDAAIPVLHVGGWRMADHDASNANHSDAAGPPPIATNKVLYDEPGASLGTPVIDELGNLYLTSSSHQAEALLSLTPAGAVRWRIAIAAGAFLSQLSLGPDGNVYAISASSVAAGVMVQIVVFDAATGAALPGSAPIAGLTRLRLPPDRRIYTATSSDTGGLAIQMRTALDAAPVWSVAEGGSPAFALSPDGATLVLADRASGTPPAPYDIVALDTATGVQRWHHALDPALDQVPPIAVDSDGRIFLASSSNSGDLHVIALSPAGAVLWDHTEPDQRFASRILIGRTAVTVATQEARFSLFSGLTVQKADGVPTATTLCGDPQAVDGDDRIYSVCDAGIVSTDPSGVLAGQWRGRATLALVLGPAGTAYEVPAAIGSDFQLFSIERDIAPTPPPPPDLVHVQVLSTFDGSPEPDVRVLFAAPNDALIADVRTDASGRASAAMAAGYVTIESRTGNFYLLTTLLGVKQGDNLVFGPAPDDRTVLGTTTVTVPPLVPGDVGPLLWTPCQRVFIQAGPNPVTVDANPACRQHADLLARADNASAFSYLPDRDLIAGGAITMPAWRPTVTTKYTLSNFPANIDFFASLSLFANVGQYAEAPLEVSPTRSATQTFDRADVGSTLLLNGFTTRTDDTNQIGDQEFFVRTPAAPAINLATPLMRWLFRPLIDVGGPAPRLTWIQEGADSATFGWLALGYDNPGTSQHPLGSFRWDVLGPVLGPGVPDTQTAGSYTLPQLPDPELRLSLFGAPTQAFVRAFAANPEVSYDQLRPLITSEIDFFGVWLNRGTEGSFLDFRGLFAVPAVTDVRFSASLVGTSVVR